MRHGRWNAPGALLAATALMFVERAFPTQLAPSRDVGFQLQGDPWKGLVTYQVGAFNGVQDNGSNLDVDTKDGKSVDARVFAHPFQEGPWEFLQGLGVGVAGTWGSEFPRLTQYKTSGNQTFFQFLGAQGNTVGLNWYLNRWIKLQLNYERTWFSGGAAGNKDRIPEGVILSRMQLSY